MLPLKSAAAASCVRGRLPAAATPVCCCATQVCADAASVPRCAALLCGTRCPHPASAAPAGPRVVHASCFCGAELADKRCGHHEFSCGGVSGAELPCGHTCGEVCHDGDCPPCPLISTVACRCGAEHAQLPCSQTGVFQVGRMRQLAGCACTGAGVEVLAGGAAAAGMPLWLLPTRSLPHTNASTVVSHPSLQCTRVCGKPLDCGRHHCEQVCHAGPCGGCRLAGPKACPCGKTQLPHAACDVVVPPCGETCGKLLRCGVHTCHERCHTGPCRTQCREVAVKHCECGKTEKRVQCQETFRCERRCTNMRGCGRHPCRRRCCDGVACPPCEEVCNKWLKCRCAG